MRNERPSSVKVITSPCNETFCSALQASRRSWEMKSLAMVQCSGPSYSPPAPLATAPLPCGREARSLSISDTPKGAAMASADVIELSDDNFESEVLKSDQPALVDFWAVWCGPCRQIAPTVEALATEYKGRLKVGKMNIDQHQIVPQQYGIRSIPTLLVFKGGQVVGQIVGAVPRAKLEDEVKKHL